MRPLRGPCAINDCTHVHEPRCAIRAAVQRHDISEERYESYRRLVAGEE
jgi:ribosome biogenesis GTPase